jgi:hypothetical protein
MIIGSGSWRNFLETLGLETKKLADTMLVIRQGNDPQLIYEPGAEFEFDVIVPNGSLPLPIDGQFPESVIQFGLSGHSYPCFSIEGGANMWTKIQDDFSGTMSVFDCFWSNGIDANNAVGFGKTQKVTTTVVEEDVRGREGLPNRGSQVNTEIVSLNRDLWIGHFRIVFKKV